LVLIEPHALERILLAGEAAGRLIWHRLSRGRSLSGIGTRPATLFVAEGVSVVVASRHHDKSERFVGALGQATGFIRTDVAVEAEWRQ
jgi:hypothetical protein